MSPLRIAIFSDNFYPEISGIVDSITTTAKELASRGHYVRFCVPRYSAANFKKAGKDFTEINLGENISIDRLPAIPVPTSTKQGRFAIPLSSYAKSLAAFKPDVIHTQLFFGAGLEALMVKRKLHVPLLGTNHTAISEFVKQTPIGFPAVERAMLKYVSWYYNHCEFVTAPSQSVFTEMEQYGFRKPHQVLSNPIDTDTFSPIKTSEEREALQREFKLSDFAIIYAGRLAPEKNIDVVLRAVAEAKTVIPNISFALAGHGAAETELKKLTQTLGLEKIVTFTGTLNAATLAKLYRAGNVFAIASTSETQSMVLMQAMASGIPVVGVNARALPEYIRPENGYIVAPGDFKHMAKNFITLAQDRSKAEAMGRAGRTHALQFSTKAIADAWENIYRNAAHRA